MFRALEAARAGGVRVGRYLVKERIGAGGMGVVYRAVDLDRAEEVALKTLQRLTPANLLRLKREFRSVADLSHENLVSLRELVSEGPDWFFTMELVQGTNLYSFIRGGGAALSPSGTRDLARSTTDLDDDGADASMITTVAREVTPSSSASGPRVREAAAPLSPLDAGGLARLRLVLPQLVDAVEALHGAGKLHRDLKPGNVLVDKRGRVVVLDFGLVGELDPSASEDTFCGTPAYAAPEQLHSPATPASDWYAVGVMLYEALTGRQPFRGDPMEVLAMKQSMTPVSPAALVDVPEDLDELAMALLARDPAARPDAARILSMIGSHGDAAPPPSARPKSSAPAALLVGRDRELGQLYAALADVRAGSSTSVRVHGGSGIGKTWLVRTFCEELESGGRALVLAGRCYERESVPYKALDPVVDALTRRISSMSEAQRAKLYADAFPEGGQRGIDELLVAFPVLRVLSPGQRAARQGARETSEVQKQAARGLAALLKAVAGTEPLVVWTDDLQWGDRDSARMIAEVLDARGSDGERIGPAVLWIGSFREGAERESAFLQELASGRLGGDGAPVDVAVTPLSTADAKRLARARLQAFGAAASGEDAARMEERADALVTESAGSPYFIEELARHLGDPREVAGGSKVTVDELIDTRLAALSPSARSLLEAVAVAGGPVAQRVALEAAGVGADAHTAIGSLRTAQLVRTSGVRPDDPIEAWHDRVRETVYARLEPERRRARHIAIAESLAHAGAPDVHRLATHFFHGGDPRRAATYALEAADRAAGALAFGRAAELYQIAMESIDDRAERARLELERRYADALVAAGRCAEAAPLYLDAARELESSGAPPQKARELRRRAAEQLLVSGRREEGIRVLRPLLGALGLKYPATPRAAMMSLVATFLKFEITGTRFKARAESAIEPRVLERADLCWAAGSGLLAVDSVRGGYFMVSALEEALRSGDRFRAARTLSIFGMMQVYSGKPRSVAKGRKIFDQAEAISASMDEPVLLGTLECCRGTADMSIGEWRRGLEELERGIEILRTRCVGVSWELGSTISSTFNARLWLGENLEIARRAPAWHRDAEAVGDWFSTISAELYMAYAALSAGKTSEARELCDRAIARWSRDSEFTYQKWLDLKIQILCDLSDDRPAAALERLERSWKQLAGSGLFGVELMLQDAHWLRGTVLLAQASAKGARAIAPRVREDVKKLERIRRPTASGCAKLLSGQIASLEGDERAAATLLEEAGRDFRAVDVALLARVADTLRGEIVGGDLGRSLLSGAEEHARLERIGGWERWVRVHGPVRRR